MSRDRTTDIRDVQVIQTLNVRVARNNVGYVIFLQRENTVVYADVSGFKTVAYNDLYFLPALSFSNSKHMLVNIM